MVLHHNSECPYRDQVSLQEFKLKSAEAFGFGNIPDREAFEIFGDIWS